MVERKDTEKLPKQIINRRYYTAEQVSRKSLFPVLDRWTNCGQFAGHVKPI